MRRALFVLLIAMVSGAALAAGAAAWLLYTEPGLAWMLARVQRAAGSALQLNEVGGTLAGGVTVESARYVDANTTVEARKLRVQVSPRSLFALAPRITLVRCEEILIATAPGGPPPRLPATLALPLPVRILDARLARIVVNTGEAPYVITDMSFGYDFDAETHHLSALSLAVGGVKVGGNAAVGAVKPFPVEAAVAAQSAAHPAARIEAKLSGTLDALQVAARTEAAGARSTLDAALAPFEPRPLERLQVTLADLDLRAFDARLPRTSIRGGAALAEAGGALAGTLELENSLSGPHDRERLPLKSLRSAVRTDMTALQLSALNADLGPGGTLVGSATVALNRFTLSASARRLNLASLHGKLRKTRLNGRIDLAATMEAQSINATLAEGEVRLDISALRSEALVEVKHARARVRGGEARATGRITLAGRQPFNLEAHFKGFDPAAWGDFPAGAISGRVSAKGTLKDRNIHADLKLEPSRLRGAPIAGTGSAEMKGEHIAANLLIEIAGNRLEVSGAFGGHADTLSVALQAPRLAAIDPRLQGHLTGTAQMTGTWQAPGAKFELSGKDLAYAEQWRATAVSARGVYSRGPDGPVELTALAAGVISPAWRIDRGTAEVKGTRLRHTVALAAQGGALDLTARAAGGWETGRGWVGTVQELVNRGNVPVVLEAPFALEAGRERLRLGAVKAQVIGGRLDMRDARYENNRLTSEGRFDAIPARTALALAGLPADAGGTLRLSGAWSLAATPRWNGTLTVRHESGDVTLGAGNALPLGLSALTLDARVIDDRIEYRGTMRAKLATGNLEGSILPVSTADGLRITGASPLKLSAAIELARLAALSGFTEATMRFDGRARAAFTAQGTLRDPLFSGTLEADELSLAHPAEGVDLRGGALRAELAGREVRIRSFSIRGGDGNFTASGVLAQGAARRAALDWQADRLTLLNRPDRRLIVTGKGNATLEGAKLALTGTLRADSGRIEISSSQLPALGEDVVVVGRKRDEPERPGLRGASLDLTFDFGDQFRLVGRGLDAAIAGRARVQTNAVGDLIAHGEVQTVRGVYHAFGQRLELERGRVVFDGSIDNPRLDIRAMRKKQAVEAGVEVLGTVRSPFVRVVSDPPLPEHEALSWLVLGRSSRDASAGDLGMLPLAAAALLNQGKSDGGIAGRLGLDSIGMRRDTVAGQIVTVGKRLTDDLYVIYEQGTGLATQALKLEYTLTQRWLVRAEAGTTSAIGLFFRWAFD